MKIILIVILSIGILTGCGEKTEQSSPLEKNQPKTHNEFDHNKFEQTKDIPTPSSKKRKVTKSYMSKSLMEDHIKLQRNLYEKQNISACKTSEKLAKTNKLLLKVCRQSFVVQKYVTDFQDCSQQEIIQRSCYITLRKLNASLKKQFQYERQYYKKINVKMDSSCKIALDGGNIYHQGEERMRMLLKRIQKNLAEGDQDQLTKNYHSYQNVLLAFNAFQEEVNQKYEAIVTYECTKR